MTTLNITFICPKCKGKMTETALLSNPIKWRWWCACGYTSKALDAEKISLDLDLPLWLRKEGADNE